MILSIINQKGGVGKTTSSINLAAGLALSGKKTLIIDADPQAHTTFTFNIEKPDKNISHVLEGSATLEETTIVLNPHLSIVPSSIRLSVTSEQIYSAAFREEILKTRLDTLDKQYDYIILDSPPNMGVLVNNIIYASDFILIPCEVSIYSLEGMSDLIATIKKIKRDAQFQNFKVLVTKYDARNKTSNAHILKQLKHFSPDLFNTHIAKNEALNQSSMAGKSIFDFAPSSKGAECYKNLTKEVLAITIKKEVSV